MVRRRLLPLICGNTADVLELGFTVSILVYASAAGCPASTEGRVVLPGLPFVPRRGAGMRVPDEGRRRSAANPNATTVRYSNLSPLPLFFKIRIEMVSSDPSLIMGSASRST